MMGKAIKSSDSLKVTLTIPVSDRTLIGFELGFKEMGIVCNYLFTKSIF